ncbi:MAG: exonuclease subunit SbcD [Bacteroidales bacterium]|nr:exonuclease subunit SbcD [Bacteroidales bacterium]
MKLLHTSDWHLGKRLEDFSRLEEQKEVLNEICDIADAEEADAVLIAGDLFDTWNPPTEALDIFYRALKKLSANGKRAVIAIAGNHDSPERIESPDPLARECGIIFTGYPNTHVTAFELETGLKVLRSDQGFLELKLPGSPVPLRIIHTAYANEFRLRTYLGGSDSEEEMRILLEKKWKHAAGAYCDEKGVNVLTGHLFMVKKGGEMPQEPEEEKPILHVGGSQAVFTENLPEGIQYAALGHLHRKQSIDNAHCPVVYSGSPLSYSFAEANQDKYVILAEIQPGERANVREIMLRSGKKLLRYRAENMDDAMAWLSANPTCLAELTVVTENYLTAEDRRRLQKTHSGLVNIIPELRNGEAPGTAEPAVDLTKNMEELFSDFFLHEKGQPAGERIMQLFRETLAQNNE